MTVQLESTRKRRMIDYLIIFDNLDLKEVIKVGMNQVLVFSIIIAFCLLLPVYRNNEIANYQNSTYDYWAQCLTRNQVEEIRQKTFVDEVFPFSIVDSVIKNNKETSSDVLLMITESLNNINISSFAPKNIISINEKILKDESTNPIILDYSLSKKLGVKVGDSVKIPFGTSKEEIPFTVGAVYQNHHIFGKYDAVILLKNSQKQYLQNINGGDLGFTMAYIKSKNKQELKNYMNNEFFPELLIKKNPELATKSYKEKVNDTEITSFFSVREDQLNEKINSLKYTPMIIMLTTILGCIIFTIIIYREENKKINDMMYNISLLYSLGLPKRKIQVLYIKKIFYEIIPWCIIALFLEKFVIYKYVAGNLFIPWYLMLNYSAVLIALILVSVIITSFLLVRKVNTAKIPYYLYKE